MRYRRFLADDEELLLDVRRHLVGRAFEVFLAAVVMASLAYGYVAWTTAPSVLRQTFLYGTLAIFLLTALRVALYRTHHLILTSDRLIVRSGLLRRSTTDLQLSRLTTVTTHQRLHERVIGKGTLEIGVAHEPDPLVLVEVAKPLQVARVISAAIDGRPGPNASIAVEPRSGAAELLTKLRSLHQRGAITDQEFEERSSDLRL